MAEFLSGNSVWLYFLIFFGKITEVTIATLRIVLINRGERVQGAFLAFFEIIIWLFITGTVLAGFQNNPLKIVVFALAFALGNYLGSWLENKIALGLITVQVITSEESADILTNQIRSDQIAVTVLDGHGMGGERKILLIHLKRNRLNATVKLINRTCPDCVISVSDIKMLRGGYIKK
ncbi:MAG: DUF5698 domain-containing protein [Clostridia bacterium]